MERLSAEAMGLVEFDGVLFREKVKEILVPGDETLEYHFFDGHTVIKTWERPRKRRGVV